MNNTFDLKRFGKYFRYDIVSAWQNAGVSILTIAAMPVWFFVIVELFSLVFTGGFCKFSFSVILTAYIVSIVLVELFFPVQHYGHLTRKKDGSDWILLPASRFEKYLSMLLVTCVVVPVVWLVVIASCDGILTLAFSNYDGMGLANILHNFDKVFGAMGELRTENVQFIFDGPWLCYLSFASSILCFTLGAIYFKKNKIVYTFLALIGVGILCSIGAGIVTNGHLEFDPTDFSDDSLMRGFNTLMVLIYVVEFAVLDILIYLRIKTIKQ
ncbi:MAG: hypothetical protein IKX45_01255 [Bacteroidales bacterium]|nr:hypothetical protein [Bacteroidales bacterium]